MIAAQILIDGFAISSLYALAAVGFTLIFGLMRVVNLAHGGTYLVGGYVGYSTIVFTHNFVLGLAAGAIAMAVFGVILERGLLLRVRGLPMSELLLTMGVAFIMGDLALAIWGGDPLAVHMPGVLDESSQLGPLTYPNSRFFILGVAALVAILLWLLLKRTRIGAIIRAGVDDREMVSAMGININLVFTGVFALGAGLAGLAGVLGGSVLTLYPTGDSDILVFALIVVIIGGLGTLEGAIVGALVVGLLDNYGKAYFPELAYFTLFAPMVLILLWRPQGLFGRSVA